MLFEATGMDLEIITLTEVVRQRQIPYDLTYWWNIKYDTNELTYKTKNRLTDIENKLMVTKGEKRGGRHKLGVWG